jgi:hypothetical protein
MLLDLTTQKEEIKHKLKCFFAAKIYTYLEFKRYNLQCSKDSLFDLLVELKDTLFLIDTMSDTCEIEKLNLKLELVMAKITGNCFDDDCLKRTQIEALIEDFLGDYYTSAETDQAIADAIAALPPAPGSTASVIVSADPRELMSVTDLSVPPAYVHEISLTNDAWSLLGDGDLTGVTTSGCAVQLRYRENGLNQLEIQGCVESASDGSQTFLNILTGTPLPLVPFEQTFRASIGVNATAEVVLRPIASETEILLRLPSSYVANTDIAFSIIAPLDA